MRPIRIKTCSKCSQVSPVLYRVKYDESGEWSFVCDRCYLSISQNNPYYTYGGTWKAQKKKR